MLGILKAGLRKLLGRALVNFHELHTILTEPEATINDRLLTYANSDVSDLEPITSSQMIRGRRLKTFPNTLTDELTDPPFDSVSTLRERTNYIDKLLTDLWKRWTTEYLLSLREVHKCLLAKKGTIWPRVGDVVLIHDDGPRSKWKLGKITGLHPGRDGFNRVADLRISAGLTTRPLVRLFPLEQSLCDRSEALDAADAQETACTQRLLGQAAPPSSPPSAGGGPASSQGATCDQRPVRQAASQSADLWRSKIKAGQL